MQPDITVVVPYHNERSSIEYSLERVGLQSLTPTEAIFVNSSSTDDSSAVVDSWIEKNQSRFETRFRNVSEKTSTPASSKNVGIRLAKTEWLAFMDCGQLFDVTWLEKQWAFALARKLDIVSGVVFLTGVNWIDRCAVAQTYGFKRTRPCVPTTLLRKSVFVKSGMFAEGRRAGYDAAWQIKINSIGIQRGINESVVIKYDGINFSDNLSHLVKKTMLYSCHSVGLEGYRSPYYYLVGALLVLVAALFSGGHALKLLLPLYVVLRGILMPTLKSRNLALLREHPVEAIFGLPLVGIVMDVAKIAGFLQGLITRPQSTSAT